MNVISHPNPQQLADFGLGKLDPSDSQWIEQHLSDCQICCDVLSSQGDDDFAKLVRKGARTNERGKSTETIGLSEQINDTRIASVQRQGRYHIVRQIGRGGMGDVYMAEHILMNRTVALKVINAAITNHPQAVDRFRREVQAAAQLSHPNVVTAYDAEVADDTLFLVMEYVDGIDLASLVKNQGPVSVDIACEYIRQAALGLEHAATKGMVHRDIKPQNLILAPREGLVRILDFGLASVATSDTQAHGELHKTGYSELTRLGNVIGTPDYIAPEQARNAKDSDSRSDIYSLGCTMFFLLTGQPPFEELTVPEILNAHRSSTFPDVGSFVSDVPDAVVKLIEKMTAREPEARFQASHEVVAALDDLQQLRAIATDDAESVGSTVKSLFSQVPQLNRKRIVMVSAIVLAVAMVVTMLSPEDSITKNSEQSSTNVAAAPSKELTKLRDEYRKLPPDAEPPKFNAANFSAKLDDWHAAHTKRQTVGRKYEAELLRLWFALPEDSEQFRSVTNELQTLTRQLQGKPNTGHHHAETSFLANAVHLKLIEGVSVGKAKVLVELTKPHLAIRVNDRLTEKGTPTEPYGWGIQSTHALALARAGKLEMALAESAMLIKKIETTYRTAKNPKAAEFYSQGKIEHFGSERSAQSLHREFLLHRSLIQALAGDVVAASTTGSSVGAIEEPDEQISEKQLAIIEAIGTAMAGE